MQIEPRARANRRAYSLAAVSMIWSVVAGGCGPAATEPGRVPGPKQAIRAVLDRDSELGTIRNHASESGTLAQAIRDYVSALGEIDFSECPPDFTAAFERHREAWRDSAIYFEQHDRLRGEMHDLFETIRGQGDEVRGELEALESEIWGTWAEVEAAAERHGAAATD